MVARAEGAVRVQNAPGVADRGVASEEAMGQGQGQHVEVAEGGDEVAAVGGGADELGQGPGLGGAVADVAIIGAALFVRGVCLTMRVS
jgi:hypothetical protein